MTTGAEHRVRAFVAICKGNTSRPRNRPTMQKIATLSGKLGAENGQKDKQVKALGRPARFTSSGRAGRSGKIKDLGLGISGVATVLQKYPAIWQGKHSVQLYAARWSRDSGSSSPAP